MAENFIYLFIYLRPFQALAVGCVLHLCPIHPSNPHPLVGFFCGLPSIAVAHMLMLAAVATHTLIYSSQTFADMLRLMPACKWMVLPIKQALFPSWPWCAAKIYSPCTIALIPAWTEL